MIAANKLQRMCLSQTYATYICLKHATIDCRSSHSTATDKTSSGYLDKNVQSNEFFTMYDDARQEITRERSEDIQLLKSIARKMQLPHFQDEPLKNLSNASIIDKSKYNDPLVRIFDRENSMSTLTMVPKNDYSNNNEFKGALAYHICLDLELPAEREVLGTGLQDFLSHSRLQQIVYKQDAKIDRKALTIVMQKWRYKKKDLYKKLKAQPDHDCADDKGKKPQQNRNTVLRYMPDSYHKKYDNGRLLRAHQYGQPVVIDMRFKDDHNRVPFAIRQIQDLFSINRSSYDPFRLIFANFKPENHNLYNAVAKYVHMENVFDAYEKSYLEMEPIISKEDLVYLSPDADKEMEEFSHSKVYIIGCLVDCNYQKALTRTIARNEQISCERFPLQKYLKWGGVTGRVGFSLDIVMKILHTLRDTNNDWIAALQHVPTRFHSGLSEAGKHLAKHDPGVIYEFERGKRLVEYKNYQANPPKFGTDKDFKRMKSYLGRGDSRW